MTRPQTSPAASVFDRIADGVFVIAEIGNNHEGSLGVAKRLVEAAATTGVDAVKFQTFRTEHFVARENVERFARLKGFELPPSAFGTLAELAHSLGLRFISTPLDLGSVDVLEPLVDAFKIASGDNTFYPLLERVAGTGKPVLLSTGLLDAAGVRRSVSYLREHAPAAGGRQVAVMHCVSAYPVPPEQANLSAVTELTRELDCPVGYSDHTVGIDAVPLAVALGARIIEKHFTLDKNYSSFRDHALSADSDDMRELVRRVRTAWQMRGTGAKAPQPCELEQERGMRRSIVAAGDLPEGHVLSADDLMWVRPGGGLAPGEESSLLGRRLTRGVHCGERLLPGDVVAAAV